MNTFEYLELTKHVETVVNALDTLRVTQDEREEILKVLTWYPFSINYRAKSFNGRVNHHPSNRRMELVSKYFSRGYTVRKDHVAKHKQTLLHETAHIITYVLDIDASAHGHLWKKVMVALGVTPTRVGDGSVISRKIEDKK